jgi:hypothetical protein
MAQSESGGIGGHFHGLRAVRVFLTWCSPVVAWAVRHLPLSSRRGANGQVSRCLTPPGRAASGYIRESSPAQPRNHLDLQRTVPSISSLSIHQQGRTLTSTPPPQHPPQDQRARPAALPVRHGAAHPDLSGGAGRGRSGIRRDRPALQRLDRAYHARGLPGRNGGRGAWTGEGKSRCSLSVGLVHSR